MTSFRTEVRRLLLISFGVFLFILFFQPFPLEALDYNSRLLYVLGFGLVVFMASLMALIVLPAILPKWFDAKKEWENGPPFLLSLFMLVLLVTAFLFYIRWVGKASLSVYIMFKALLVSLMPVAVLVFMYKHRAMEREIDMVQDENLTLMSKLRRYETSTKEEEVDIYTENREKKLRIKIKDIIYIKSADNYIEFFLNRDNTMEKKLVRCTLKSIEMQLFKYRDLIRCHRTLIINREHIDKLVRSYSGYELKMKNCEDKLPVSRHYLKSIRDLLENT